MRTEIHTSHESVTDLETIWLEATRSGSFHAGAYADYTELTGVAREKLRIAVLRSENGGRAVIAPFTLGKRKKKFSVGERHLFSLGVDTLALYSQWLMQQASEDQIGEIFYALESNTEFDWVDLGEIPIGSHLHNSLGKLGWRWIVSERSRKASKRWLIDFPDDFDAYLQTLKSKTRQSIKRKMRKLENKFSLDLEIITKTKDIERFLQEGEKISRTTYQWNVGQKLRNDEETRSKFASQCERGILRCYLLSINGRPGAFLRGTIENGIYNYETPGFDPEFRKDSVGNVMLMYAVRELIENTNCKVFDFGTGGDETGYKSTFGTRSIDCTYIELGRRTSFRANIVAGLQYTLNKAKNVLNKILGQGTLRRKIKAAIRKFGE